jgi:TolB-like protein
MMVASLTCFIGACSLFATTDRNIPTETQIIENQNNIPLVGNFNDRVNSLAEQLHKNAAPKTLSNTYIITSFSNLDKLNHTTALGRLISENLMHGLQVHKWNILEIRLTKGIDVNAAGEFSLSRDVSKLKDEYKISGVVAGTYSVAEGNLTINARVIDVNTGLLISSAQTYIPVNWIPDVALSGDNGSKSMKITSDGIK